MNSNLALGAICLYVSNAYFHRPAEGCGSESLIERYCQQVLEDLADDEDDEDAPTVPVLYDNGAYFICDIRTFEAEYFIRIYHKSSMDDIRSSFAWSAAPLS
ncbi:hypothetical protein BDR04DRAFT_1123766, partial [Suillus decipiens]